MGRRSALNWEEFESDLIYRSWFFVALMILQVLGFLHYELCLCVHENETDLLQVNMGKIGQIYCNINDIFVCSGKLVSHLITISHNIRGSSVSYLQNTLSADNITSTNLTGRSPSTSSSNSNSKSLKSTLSTMMIIITISATNMERHVRGLSKTLQTVCNHFSAQITDLLAAETKVNHSPRPT